MDLRSSFGGLRNEETYEMLKRIGYSADDTKIMTKMGSEVTSAARMIRPKKQMILSASLKAAPSVRYAVSVVSTI